MSELSEVDKAWLACAIDGEGSIILQLVYQPERRGKRLNLQTVIEIGNKNLEFLEKAKELLNTSCNIAGKDEKSRTFCTRLLKREEIRNILSQIAKYLIVTREQAGVLLDFLESLRDESHSLSPRHHYTAKDLTYSLIISSLNTGKTIKEIADGWKKRVAGRSEEAIHLINEAVMLLEDYKSV